MPEVNGDYTFENLESGAKGLVHIDDEDVTVTVTSEGNDRN